MIQDHYFILQIHQDASAEEIQRAYRTLALRYHPDRNTATDAAAQMTAINEAYDVLRDRARRKAYDGRRAAVNPNTELVTYVLQAARDVILRAGWTVLQDGSETLLLGKGKQRARVVFVGRLTNEMIRKLS